MSVQELAIQTDSPLAEISAGDIMLNAPLLKQIDQMATRMASAKNTMPKHLQGQEGDCWAICMQAVQWRMNPYAVAQKTHLVNGTLGYEAQLVSAVVNSRAPIKDRLNYEWFGDWKDVNGKTDKNEDRGVKVWATMKGEDEPRFLELPMSKVGSTRNSPLWVDDPRQQIAYLAAKRWARLHCSDVILGVYTPDELQEIDPVEREIGPATSDLNAALKGNLVTQGDEVIDVVDEPEPKPEEEKEPMTFAMVAEAINNMPDINARQGIAQMTAEFVGIEGNEKFHEELTEIFKKKVASLKAVADNDPANQ